VHTTADIARCRTEIRPRRGWARVDLRELWRARDLLAMFAARDIKVRYKQTFFGYAWAVIVPSVQVLVFSVFFGAMLGVGDRVDEAAGRPLPYPLFALAGQIVWNFFKMSVDGASRSLLDNGQIIRKIYIPRLVLPISALGKPSVDTAVVFVLMVGLTVFYAVEGSFAVEVTPTLAAAPLLLVAAAIPALAIGLIMAAITVHYRDLTYVLPFVISILFYVTPVIYPVDVLPDGYRWLIYLNPIAGFVDAHRACVMQLPINWVGLATSAGLSVVLLGFGLLLFARTERAFADVA